LGVNSYRKRIIIQVNDDEQQARIGIGPDEALAFAEAILYLHRSFFREDRFNRLDGKWV
jgi:hypothetical protein